MEVGHVRVRIGLFVYVWLVSCLFVCLVSLVGCVVCFFLCLVDCFLGLLISFF